MAQATFSVRMEEGLKKQFDALCNEFGMSVSTAINVFARAVVREYRIPFEISAEVPNAETAEAIGEVQRMKADPTLGKTYTDVDQMMGELLSDV